MKTGISYSAILLMMLSGLMACQKDPEIMMPATDDIYFPPINRTDWETQTPGELGWNVAKIPDLLQFLEAGNTRAFIVLKNGKIIIEEYFGKDLLGVTDFSANSNWYWASAAKTLTAFTVGLAQEDGLLEIQRRSADYLGEEWANISDEQMEAITVRHHLTMTTGLDDGVADKDCTDPECLLYLAPPGTRWAYHNAPYTILDRIVEGATQQSFDDYFRERLSKRIGMDGFWRYVNYNHLYFSTARSMARFGLLNLNRGKWKDVAIMSDLQYFEEMTGTSQEINPSYGYLWWLNGKSSYQLPGLQLKFNGSISPAAPADMFSGLGKNGQFINVVPSQDLVVIRMGDNPDNALVPVIFLNEMWEILSEVIR